MTRLARAAGPAAVTLFALAGLLLSEQPAGQAAAGAALAVVTAVVLAWRDVGGWPLVAGLAVAAAGIGPHLRGAAVQPGLVRLLRARRVVVR